MAVDRKQQMKEITERLEQGVKDIFTSEMYTTYSNLKIRLYQDLCDDVVSREEYSKTKKNFCARRRMRGCRLRTAGMKQKIPCAHRFCKFIIISGKTRN